MKKMKFLNFMKVGIATLATVFMTLGFAFAGTVAASAEATPKEVTVEDIFDVTENLNGEGEGVSSYVNTTTSSSWGFGKSSVTENFEFVSHVTLNITNTNRNVPLGILLTEASTSGLGYWFDIQTDVNMAGNENAYIALYDGSRTSKAVASTYAKLDSEWHDVIYGKNGFDFRFGAVDYYEGETFAYTYVYVYINGELFMDYEDTSKNAGGSYIGADDNWGRVTYLSVFEPEPKAVTVEDIYDVTKNNGAGKASYTNTGATVWSIGKSSVEENFEFSTRVILNFGSRFLNFPLGILLDEASGDGVGYWFDIQYQYGKDKDTGELFPYAKIYLHDGARTSAAVQSGTAKAEWYGASGYDLRFGAVDCYRNTTFMYTKVYVIINGETVFEYYDATKNEKGTYIAADEGNTRVELVATKNVTAKTATVEDIYDVTGNGGTATRAYYNTAATQWLLGKSSVQENFEFSSLVTLNLGTRLNFPIGILLSEASRAGVGYWFDIQYQYGKNKDTGELFPYAKIYLHDGEFTSAAVKSGTAKDEWYGTNGYDFRFGAVDCYKGDEFVYTKVYVIINGETVFEYYDVTKNEKGEYIAADEGNARVELYSTKLKVEKEEEITVYDVADVWEGPAICGSITGIRTGETANKNMAFRARIEMLDKHPDAWIGFMLDVAAHTSGSGYFLKINAETGLSLVQGAYSRGRVIASTPVQEKMYKNGGAVLEIGAVENVAASGERVYTRVYVKLDGETIMEYLDRGIRNFGSIVLSDTYKRCNVYTAKDVEWTFGEVEKVDWYDLTGQFSTLYGYTGSEMTAGTLPRNKNVAIVTKLTFGDVEFSKDYIFQLCFIKNSSALNSRCGYRLKITESQLLLRGDRYQINIDTDAAVRARPDSIGPGKTVELEIGTQEVFTDGEYFGDKIYVKVNGEDYISFIDVAPHQENGTFVLSPLGNKVGGYAEFATAKQVATFTSTDEEVGFKSYTVFAEEDFTLNIPVETGLKITKVTLDGEEVEFTLVEGGAVVAFKAGTTGGKIAVETERATLTATVTGAEDYTLDGATDGSFAYGSNLTLSFARPEGKTLASLTVGGVDKLSEVTYDGGRYALNLYALIENVEIVCTFADAATYTVTVTQAAHGHIEVSAQSVKACESVTVNVTPDEGYRVLSLTVNGKKVSINANGEYVLENVSENVTVTAEYVEYVPVTIEETNTGCSSIVAIGWPGAIVLGAVALTALALMQRRKRDE